MFRGGGGGGVQGVTRIPAPRIGYNDRLHMAFLCYPSSSIAVPLVVAIDYWHVMSGGETFRAVGGCVGDTGRSFRSGRCEQPTGAAVSSL